jgi:hypothetical protein
MSKLKKTMNNEIRFLLFSKLNINVEEKIGSKLALEKSDSKIFNIHHQAVSLFKRLLFSYFAKSSAKCVNFMCHA